MEFFLGYISGILTATLVVSALTLLRTPIERRVEQARRTLEAVGPRPKGFIFEPEDEAETARKEHVRRNAEQGRDTPISELQ